MTDNVGRHTTDCRSTVGRLPADALVGSDSLPLPMFIVDLNYFSRIATANEFMYLVKAVFTKDLKR